MIPPILFSAPAECSPRQAEHVRISVLQHGQDDQENLQELLDLKYRNFQTKPYYFYVYIKENNGLHIYAQVSIEHRLMDQSSRASICHFSHHSNETKLVETNTNFPLLNFRLSARNSTNSTVKLYFSLNVYLNTFESVGTKENE